MPRARNHGKRAIRPEPKLRLRRLQNDKDLNDDYLSGYVDGANFVKEKINDALSGENE